MNDAYLVLLPILFVGSIVSTISGSGLGIFIIVTLSFFEDIRTSVVIMSLVGLWMGISKVWHFHMHADKRIVKWYLVTCVPAAYIGGQLLYSLPIRAIEIVLGVLLLVFVITRITPLRFHVNPTITNLLVLGGVNGFVAGIVGYGALLRAPFILSFGLLKDAFVGTASIITLATSISKVSAYVSHVEWTRDLVWLIILSGPCIFFGVRIGKKLLPYVSKVVFEAMLLSIIVIGAIRILL